MVPPFGGFADCTTNNTSPVALNQGTNFTAGLNNADGSSVGVLSALAHDVHFLVIGLGGISASNANSRTLVDILVDPAGGTSWSAFIDDLTCGFCPAFTAAIGLHSQYFYFPIYIKSGTSIGLRARTVHTANLTTGYCLMWAFGNPSLPQMWWCGTGVETLGITAASSSGTDVSSGASNAWAASWTTIGTSTHPYGCVQMGHSGPDSSTALKAYHFQIGYGDTQLPGSPTFYSALGSVEASAKNLNDGPIWCNVASGTTWQARGKCSTTSPEVFDVGIYGVY